MSYVRLEAGVDDAKRAVISLWFRVPEELLAAATAEFKVYSTAWDTANANGDPPPLRPPLVGIVPLMVFGPPSQAKGYDFPEQTIGTFPQRGSWVWSDGSGSPDCVDAGWKLVGDIQPAGPFTAGHYVLNDKVYAIDPSYIGVDCTGDNPALSLHIVMPNSPSKIVGSHSTETSYASSASGIPDYGGGGSCPGAPEYWIHPTYGFTMKTVGNPPTEFSSVWTSTDTYGGNADLLLARPEIFRLLPLTRTRDGHYDFADAADQSYGGKKVSADHWHHLLLSFDLTNSCITHGVVSSGGGDSATPETAGGRTDSACKMWVAFDDVNLTGKDLSCYWPHGFSDQNGILTVTGYFTACDTVYNASDTITDYRGTTVTAVSVHEQPSYAFAPNPVPFKGHPLALPAVSTYVDAIKNVELADLQIFTGVTLDTGSVLNRRAFVDANGLPVPPAGTAVVVEPGAPPSLVVGGSIELLGKKPEIVLRGSGNWIGGRNTGTLGMTGNGVSIPSGQFVPTGKIIRYKPDPQLSGHSVLPTTRKVQLSKRPVREGVFRR